MLKKQPLKISVLILISALGFIFVKPAKAGLETQLLVDVSPSTDYVPYLQTQWYGFTATGAKGYCAILSPSMGNSELYLFDTYFNRAGYSRNSGTTQDKVWYGQANSGPMHIACYGAYNPSTNYTIQVITAPYVRIISPSSGTQGTLVTLYGFGFGDTRGTNYVKFATVTATNYYSWTNTQIKVYVPSGVPAGIIQVVAYVASRPSNPTNFSLTGASSNGTMWRYDLARTGNHPNGPTALPLSLKWNAAVGWCANSASPVVADNRVYVPIDRYLYVFDANTGSNIWTYGPFDGYADYTPAIANGIVYLGTNSSTLYALDSNTKSLKWKKKISDWYGFASSPAVFNSVVYFGNPDGKVYALDAATGNTKWSYATGEYIYSSPAIANGIIYIYSWQKVYALDANTGSLKWSCNPNPPECPFSLYGNAVVVSNGVVYIGDNKKIYALNANTGGLNWIYNTESNITSSCAIVNGIVYFGCENNTVYALDTVTRTLKWSYSVPISSGSYPAIYSSPAVSNGIVYFGTRDNKVYALDAATGAVRWSYDIGNDYASGIGASPGIWNGKVYISSYSKGVYCFGQ